MSMTLPVALAKQHIARVFIETGTSTGGGIQTALDAGFAVVHSIELDRGAFEIAQARFKDQPNVHLWHGESPKVLQQLLPSIDEPVTFWLDAHPLDGPYTPLMEELKVIDTHHIKTHTIMIDDRRLFAGGVFGQWTLTEKSVRHALLRINPAYKLSVADNFVGPDDILVAYLEK